MDLPFYLQEFAPLDVLKPFVSRWVNVEFSHPDDEYLHKIAPSGRLIMNHAYGEPYYGYKDNGECITYRNATYFKGHRLKEPLKVKMAKGVKNYVSEFTYTGFYRLFHIPADRMVDIEYEISDFGLEDLEKALFSTANLMEKREIANSYLVSLIPYALEPDQAVEDLIESMEFGMYEFGALNRLKESEKKKIYRKFKRNTGLSIKQFKRIHQMNSAIKMMGTRDYKSLTELALKSGYYDQADFIKHVNQFFGQSPKELEKSEHDLLFKYMGGPKKDAAEASGLFDCQK